MSLAAFFWLGPSRDRLKLNSLGQNKSPSTLPTQTLGLRLVLCKDSVNRIVTDLEIMYFFRGFLLAGAKQ